MLDWALNTRSRAHTEKPFENNFYPFNNYLVEHNLIPKVYY